MTMRGKLSLLVFLFCSVLVFPSVSLGKEDPELKQCKQQCKVQQEFDQKKRQECEDRCDKYYKEEQQRGARDEEGGEEFWNPDRPEMKLRECQRQCEQREREEKRECQRRCLEEFKREEEQGGRGRYVTLENKKVSEEQCKREHKERHSGGESNPRHEGEGEGEETEGQQEGKPFVFDDQHFTTKFETPHGKFKVLQKFTDRSDLFRGIENYRVVIAEADPQTFIVPHHYDAEVLIFVAKGRGSISLVRNDKRESFNINCGDVLKVPAGVTVYMINRSNNQKLVVVKLLQPVSTPGHFEVFFGQGGKDPESYYKAFSTELLEAALNTRRDRLQKIFGQQSQGPIIKASEEQIRAMSHQEEGGVWPFGEKSKVAFNLFHKRSSLSNQYGQLYEVSPNDYKDLEDLDLGIGFANISEGALITPFYNSRATKIAIVTNGEGYFEIACPHLSSSEFAREGKGGSEGRQQDGGRQGGKTGPSYHRVRAQLRPGMVLVVPAGHPVITVASKNQNLEILGFYAHAMNNERFLLAGRRNIINQLEKEAKELGFGVDAKEVDEVFQSQDEEFFLKGLRKQQYREGRAEA